MAKFSRRPLDRGEVLGRDSARLHVRLRPHDRLAHLRAPLRYLQSSQVSQMLIGISRKL